MPNIRYRACYKKDHIKKVPVTFESIYEFSLKPVSSYIEVETVSKEMPICMEHKFTAVISFICKVSHVPKKLIKIFKLIDFGLNFPHYRSQAR
jgi:hypothetical protein